MKPTSGSTGSIRPGSEKRGWMLAAAVAVVFAAGCQREAVTPEMDNAPERADTAETPLPSAQAPAAGAPQTGAGGTAAGMASDRTATGQAEATMSGAGAQEASLQLVTAGVPHPYLADASGRALYYVEGDKDGSKCTGPCLDAWPPFLAPATQPTGDANLQEAISVITRPDGSRQVTYNQRPLYRYAGDAGSARLNGNGVRDKAGQWHAIGADGEPLPGSEASPGEPVKPGEAAKPGGTD